VREGGVKYNPNIHHRRSIRLKDYDYSQTGAYFITICVQERKCIYGEIVDGKMILNDAGIMVKKWLHELPNKFHDIQCDIMCIMPNHIHFIINNVGADLHMGADLHVCPDDVNIQFLDTPKKQLSNMQDAPLSNINGEHIGKMGGEHIGKMEGEHTGSPLGAIIQWFKTMTTNEYIRNVKHLDWAPFNKRLWQRNYYEHIIRDDDELKRTQQYILNNPMNWGNDNDYPVR
jgi:REP element-mobilizing transposase RayT